MKSKDILNELRKEIDETKQKPFSREEVVILSRNEKIAIDNKILCLQEENSKLKKVIEILKDKIEFEDLGEMQSGNMYRGYFNDCLDEEEVKSVKEVFGNVEDKR